MPSITVTPLAQRLASVPPGGAHMGKPHTPYMRAGRQRFRFWYDAIIDWMLMNPDKNLRDCAKALGRGEGTIYSITSSDIFKARLAQRRQDYNDQLAQGIGDAASGVALAALTEIRKRINENAAKIPTVVLNDIANKSLERLGYGSAPVAPPAVQINHTTNTGPQISVSVQTLLEAKAAMQDLHRSNATIIDMEPTKLSSKEERDLESII